MKTVESLVAGESLLTTVRKVKGGMFQVELAEVISNPSARQNVLADLHMGDSRFDVGRQKARRGWTTANAESLKTHFGIDVTTLTFNDKGIAEVNLLNPTVKGNRLVLQIMDSFKAAWAGQEPKQTKNGEGAVLVFYKEGKPLFSNTQIVAEKDCKHQIITSDERRAYAEYEASVAAASASVDLNAE